MSFLFVLLQIEYLPEIICNSVYRKVSQTWEKESENPEEDGHQWRKYGQKKILHTDFPRYIYTEFNRHINYANHFTREFLPYTHKLKYCISALVF